MIEAVRLTAVGRFIRPQAQRDWLWRAAKEGAHGGTMGSPMPKMEGSVG